MMEVSVSIAITGTITIGAPGSGGGGDPGPTPLAVSDFKNGVYSIGGVTKTFDEMWEQKDDWGSFDPALLVAGVGLRASATNDGAQPGSTADLFAAVNTPDGVRALLEYSLDATGDGAPTVGIAINDLPGFSEGWECWDNSAPVGVVCVEDYTNEGSPDPSAQIPTTMGAHKLAIDLVTEGLSFSRDGADPTTWVSSQANASRNSLIMGAGAATNGGTATAILEKITFYDPSDATSLADLSAL